MRYLSVILCFLLVSCDSQKTAVNSLEWEALKESLLDQSCFYKNLLEEIKQVDPAHGLIQDWEEVEKVQHELKPETAVYFNETMTFFGSEIISLLQEIKSTKEILSIQKEILIKQQFTLECCVAYNKKFSENKILLDY